MKVYIAPRKGYDHYHTDRDCWSLNQANRIKEEQLENVDGELDECTFCKGDFDRDSENRTSLRDMIANGEVDTENL